jgi:hypothetical protein
MIRYTRRRTSDVEFCSTPTAVFVPAPSRAAESV